MTSWPAGLRDHAELDSTNDEARRLAQAGESGPLWITAARQTAGRGRRGRQWQSAEGNLAATLLIRPARPKAEWAQLSFVAAIAVADMTAPMAPSATIAVKWPNDVLAEGRKLAGILLETAGEALAIGIGVNLNAHPSDTEFPAISLAALGAKLPSPEGAMALLAPGFAGWYDQWESAGFAPIRDAWLARAAGLGQRIRARLADTERVGVFEGIDAQGALLLNEGSRTRAIAAGEVFFG
ncbi:MAG TPA: biotin--[acetyl-CoA-carboxylase] ligase [Rhizomicrobium sp.]|nr:biotin--[acetyl-CoA-carboxylase] ligase [Rhizomicrobium sp.]